MTRVKPRLRPRSARSMFTSRGTTLRASQFLVIEARAVYLPLEGV